jgi:hypothetical protein
MTRRSLVAARALLRCMCGFAVLTLPTAACGGETQGTGPQATSRAGDARGSAYDPKTYALDEAKVRKMAAVMRAWDPKGPEPTSNDPNVFVDKMGWMRKGVEFENKVVTELLNQNSTATIESVPELKTAIAREGLSPREFAEAYLAYKTAEGELLVTGLSQLAGAVAGTSKPASGQPEPKHSGVFKDNIELITRMDKEGTLPRSWSF